MYVGILRVGWLVGQLWKGTGFVIQLVDLANLKQHPLSPLDLLDRGLVVAGGSV